MKALKVIAKIVLALAAVAGIVYVIATYGDRIVAWARKLLNRCNCCCSCEGDCDDCDCEEDCDNCPCECTCECPCTEEQESNDGAVVADQADFEG